MASPPSGRSAVPFFRKRGSGKRGEERQGADGSGESGARHQPGHAKPFSETRAGSALSGALTGSMDSLGDGMDAAWQGLKSVSEAFRDPKRVGVRAADQPTAEWLRQLASLLSKVGAE